MTPDVNVLVAASRSDHPHHRCAMDWVEGALAAAARGDRLRLLPMVGLPTPLAADQAFLAALLSADGVELLPLGGEWPLLEPLCLQHALVGNAIADGWIAAAGLAAPPLGRR